MPSPGSQGGASPVDDDSPTPELLPVSGPLVLVVSGTTPEVLPALVPVAVGSLVPVADGSTVVLVGPAVVGPSVVVCPFDSELPLVGVVVDPSPVPVAGESVALPTLAPVDPWVAPALTSVVPVASPQPANPRVQATALHPIHTRLFMPPILTEARRPHNDFPMGTPGRDITRYRVRVHLDRDARERSFTRA